MTKEIINNFVFWENTNTLAAINLAIEESLLDSTYTQNQAVFMLWQNSPAVIIGRHQNAFEEVDMSYLKENSIALVRRTTGGGAVYHDLGNLNFSFIIPTKSPKVDFKTYLAPITEVLNKFHIQAKFSGRNDILTGEKKISGSAQAKGKHATLVHGTLLIDVNMETLEHVLSGNPDKYTSKGIASIRSRVANIKEFFPENLTRLEVINEIKGALADYFVPNHNKEENNLPQSVVDKILDNAKYLAGSRYANLSWNLMKHPPFTSSVRKKFPFGSMKVNYNVNQGIITECRIEGDFFALKDISPIEKALESTNYNSEAIKNILHQFDFSEFILNAPTTKNTIKQESVELIKLFTDC